MDLKIFSLPVLLFLVSFQDIGSTLKFSKSLYEFMISNNNPRNAAVGRVLETEAKSKRSAAVSTKADMSIVLQNNNFPVFLFDHYSFVVPRSAPVGFIVGKISATDADIGQNGVIRYHLSSNPYKSYFTVNERDGSITLAKALTDVSENNIVIPVVATDGGETPVSSITTVKIAIINPVSTTDSTTASFQSNLVFNVLENIPINTKLGQISHSNASSYQIVPMDTFAVDSDGFLYTKHMLDREIQSEYHITVFRQQSSNNNIYQYSIIVHVLDANDNAPVFSAQKYAFTVSKSASVGDEIGQVLAIDADLGPYGIVNYHINTLPYRKFFNIDNTNGIISVLKPLIEINQHQVEFPIFATDEGQPQLTSQVLVTININDPIASTTQSTDSENHINLIFHVKENLPAGIFVGQLNHTADVKYMIQGRVPFAINASDGSLHTLATLDRENTAEYNFNILTSGPGHTWGNDYTVTVVVDDVNDNTPTFLLHLYQATVLSNSHVGLTVLRVEATDADASATINYSLPSFSGSVPFTIDSHTGEISITGKLLAHQYEFSVAASDGKTFYDINESTST